jgi:SAM-dependent methyltransferase
VEGVEMEPRIINRLRKWLIPYNYYKVLSKAFGCNLIVDRVVTRISTEVLHILKNVEVSYHDLKQPDYLQWIMTYYPEWQQYFSDIRYKKLLEFFITFTFLQIAPTDVFMDAAGAITSYIRNVECEKKYMQDIRISQGVKIQMGLDIDFIESDAGAIPLPDASVDKISCHHSFEHFQGNCDTMFIMEVQRLLRPGGRCCIVPIFILDRYAEVTDIVTLARKFDRKSTRVIDPSAVLPGGRACAHYARIYDVDAFQKRVLDVIDRSRFAVVLQEITMEGSPIPDLNLECHRKIAKLEQPYRAMTITRIA